MAKVSMNKSLCILCDKEFEGHGHSAAPVKEGRCCSKCNYQVVIPHRINMSQLPNIYN